MPVAPVARDEQSRARVYDDVARLHARVNCASVYASACQRCDAKSICSGIYQDYGQLYGFAEATPIEHSTPISDPLHFIRQQQKLVEREDETWALPASYEG
jgi:hypothetical protein